MTPGGANPLLAHGLQYIPPKVIYTALSHVIKVSNVHHHFTRGRAKNFVIPSVSGVPSTIFNIVELTPSDVKNCTFNGFKSAARQYLRSQLQLMESEIKYLCLLFCILICSLGFCHSPHYILGSNQQNHIGNKP